MNRLGTLALGGAAGLAIGYAMAARRPPSPFPRERRLDSTLDFLREGYPFISSRCDRYGSDAFEARLGLERVTCVRGDDAARMFYEPGRFTRRWAVPQTALMLLQDWGSVQTLDGEAHRHRKELFTSILDAEGVQRLVAVFEEEWRRRASSWRPARTVVVHTQMREVLCAAVCRWAGVPLPDPDLRKRAREFGAMIDGAGSVGPRNWRGLVLRARTERWLRGVIRDLRQGPSAGVIASDAPGEATPAARIAWHLERNGRLLPVKIAAVELINLLRPTVAVARFITFAVHAMHLHPDARARITAGDARYLEWFVHEVRRFYPFFPGVGGRVRHEFAWRGRHFRRGDWVMLDLYGTNRHREPWGDPRVFRPERFADWDGSPYNFIPQGGGDYATTHRCPGEPATIELMKSAVRLLASLDYEVPRQDLRVRLNRMPALPESGVRIRVTSGIVGRRGGSHGRQGSTRRVPHRHTLSGRSEH